MNPWWWDMILHAAPALITVIIGGFFIHRFFIKRNNIANTIDAVCDKLNALKNDSAEYWASNYSDTESEKRKAMILESKIKASLLCLQEEIMFLNGKYDLEINAQQNELITLNDLCAGGNFESKKRKADKERFFKIVNSINKITMTLRRHKI